MSAPRSIRRAAAAALFVLVASPTAARAAAPGTPDAAFGTGGVAALVYPGQAAQGMTLLPTPGALVAAGDTATTTSNQGQTIVAGLTATGAPVAGFGSMTPWTNASPSTADAVREPGGRIVVARSGTPGNAFPNRTELVGYDANGHLDPTFGTGGRRLLTGSGTAVRLLQSPSGTLLVVGDLADGTPGPSGIFLTRVSATGTELGRTTIPVPTSSFATVSAATLDGTGGVLAGGTDDAGLFLARFTPAGAPDAVYGIKRPPLGRVELDDMTIDAAGRLLVAGARIGNFGRSVDTPLRPLLVRMSTAGVIDGTFAAIGRGEGADQADFTSVRTGGAGRIYVSDAQGPVLRFAGTGRPDLSFGAGGISTLPPRRLFDMSGLLLQAPYVLTTGDALAPTGFDNRLAVERIKVTGTGIPGAKRHVRVQVRRLAKKVAVRMPAATADQSLGVRIAAPLTGRHISGGDGFFFTPPAVEVTARRGLARVTGVGGRADVRGGRFTLRNAPRGKVAELAFFGARCGHPETVTVALTGPFRLRAGSRLIANRSHVAKVRLFLRCGHKAVVFVLSGNVRVVG